MAGERRTRAKTRENPSPGGFRSLDAEPRKTRKKATRATAKRNAEAEQAQVQVEQVEQQQRLPSPTPTASNSMVSADSRSVSEGDESRSTASPAPLPQDVKPTRKRAKTPVATPSLLDTLEKEVDNKSTRTRSNKNRKRARAEDDTSNPDEAHEQHPAKRNRPSEPEMIQNNDKLMPHKSVEQQAPGLQDDATAYASQNNDIEVQEEPDQQQTPTPLRYSPQVHPINGDETVQEKAPQYQTPAIEPDTPQIHSSNKEVVEEDDAPTPTPQRYTPQINNSDRVGAVQENPSLQGDDAHTSTPNDHTPQGDTHINGSKAIQQDNSRKTIDSPTSALSSQQSFDKALTTIPQGNNLATPAKASTEPEKSSLTTGGKRSFIRSRIIYEPKRMAILPPSVTRGPVWDSWVSEEWAIYTKTPIGGFDRTRPAHKGFESLLKKGSRGGIPVRRTWEQFEADTKKGIVLPLPSFELDNSNVTENEVDSEDEDHSALELSIMESPFRKDTPAQKSKPTSMAESHSSVRKEASSVNSKEIVAGSQSTPRQETLFGKPRKAAADPQHTTNEGASSGRAQKIVEPESNTGSKEVVRTSSLRSSMTNSITPAPVPNPFASLRIEEHILTHPAMLEIVKVASQAFSADEGRLSKPIPDVAEFASFLDRYQRGGAAFSHPLLIQDPADESMDTEAPVVMSDEESELLDNLSEPRTPSPEPEAQPEQKSGWLDMLKTPFKFIAGGTKSAGNTPARNGVPVGRAGNARPKSAGRAHGHKKGPVGREQKKLQRPASASANTPFVSAPLADPFKSSANPKERKWIPIEQRDRMDPKRIAEIQEIHRRQDEEKKREEDIHREERQKKRAIGLAKQGEWEVERMNETTGCLHVERYKMVNGKRKLLESRPKNDSFNCNFLDYSDSDSDDESETSEDADSPPQATNANEPQRQSPPKERIFAPYRRSVGIKGVNSPEEPEEPQEPQEPEEQPEDRSRVRAYNGRIFKAQKYIQDNVNAGRHPLRSPKSPKTPTPAQPSGNIFSESTVQENDWTQSPPPAPKPGNATLPNLSQDEATKAQKAREQAEKYKPKKSSRLCEVQHASPLHEKENLDPALMSLLNNDPLTWPGDAAVNEAVARIPDDDIITGPTTEDILEAHRQSNSIDHAVDAIFN